MQITWPDIGWLDFYHWFRFEQRFFFYENIDTYWYTRARYLVRARTIDFRLIGKSKSFFIKGMWKLFVLFCARRERPKQEVVVGIIILESISA